VFTDQVNCIAASIRCKTIDLLRFLLALGIIWRPGCGYAMPLDMSNNTTNIAQKVSKPVPPVTRKTSSPVQNVSKSVPTTPAPPPTPLPPPGLLLLLVLCNRSKTERSDQDDLWRRMAFDHYSPVLSDWVGYFSHIRGA
jgi:hypothetical protein